MRLSRCTPLWSRRVWFHPNCHLHFRRSPPVTMNYADLVHNAHEYITSDVPFVASPVSAPMSKDRRVLDVDPNFAHALWDDLNQGKTMRYLHYFPLNAFSLYQVQAPALSLSRTRYSGNAGRRPSRFFMPARVRRRGTRILTAPFFLLCGPDKPQLLQCSMSRRTSLPNVQGHTAQHEHVLPSWNLSIYSSLFIVSSTSG